MPCSAWVAGTRALATHISPTPIVAAAICARGATFFRGAHAALSMHDRHDVVGQKTHQELCRLRPHAEAPCPRLTSVSATIRRTMGTGIGAPTPAARLSTIAMVRACGQVYGHRLLSRRVRVARPDQDHEVALAPLLDLRSMPHAAKRPFALEQRLIGLAAVPEALSQDFRVC